MLTIAISSEEEFDGSRRQKDYDSNLGCWRISRRDLAWCVFGISPLASFFNAKGNAGRIEGGQDRVRRRSLLKERLLPGPLPERHYRYQGRAERRPFDSRGARRSICYRARLTQEDPSFRRVHVKCHRRRY